MKSFILLSSLLFLVSCGKEQFGTAAQSESTQADSLKSFAQTSCSSFTLIRPKVDILYVVDNSGSTHHISQTLKTSIKKTLSTISADFDYRVISTPLMSTSHDDYHVFTNSSQQVPSTSKIVPDTDSLITPIFSSVVNGVEGGLSRTINFMNHHAGTGLLRNGAYHLVILVSNGQDQEVEETWGLNGETRLLMTTTPPIVSVYSQRLTQMNQVKATLASQQLRFFSVTASSACQAGWYSSQKSYQQMSRNLYQASLAGDSSTQDVYDLCGSGFTNLFSGVNSSIQKVLQKHEYRYWPIGFASSNESTIDLSTLKVYKVSNNVSQLMDPSTWAYHEHTSTTPLNTRVLPTVGEPVAGKHFVRFNQNIVYPDCVQITSTTKTEYFGYITLPRKPVVSSIIVKINGVVIPQGVSNGWTFKDFVTYPINIKMPYPTAAHALPEVKRSGYMIQLNGTQNYYKSGDSVEVHYTPDAI